MAIFKLNLKRLFKDPINLVFIIIIPILSLLIVSFFSIGQPQKIMVGVVSEENDPIVRSIESKLSPFCEIVKVERNKIKYELIFSSLDCIVVFPNRLSSKLLNGENFQLQIYSFSKTGYYVQIKNQIETTLSIYSKLAQSSKNEDEFLKKISEFSNAPIKISTENFKSNQNSTKLQVLLGFLILSIMTLSLNSMSVILKDKEENTLIRIMTSSCKPKDYVLEVILSIVITVAFQVLVYLGLIKAMFKENFLKDLQSSSIAVLMCILLFVSLSMFVITFMKDRRQLGALMPILLTVLPMLGGCYWPPEIMPHFVQKLSLLVPTTYAMNVAKEVLIFNKGFLEIKVDLLILSLFSAAFILLSIKGFSKNVLGRV